MPRSIPVPIIKEATDSIDLRQLQNADADEFTPGEFGEGVREGGLVETRGLEEFAAD